APAGLVDPADLAGPAAPVGPADLVGPVGPVGPVGLADLVDLVGLAADLYPLGPRRADASARRATPSRGRAHVPSPPRAPERPASTPFPGRRRPHRSSSPAHRGSRRCPLPSPARTARGSLAAFPSSSGFFLAPSCRESCPPLRPACATRRAR